MTTEETEQPTVSQPGSSPPPRSPTISGNLYGEAGLSLSRDAVGDLQASTASAEAVEDLTGHDERATNAWLPETRIPWESVFDAWERDAADRLRPGTLRNHAAHIRKTFEAIGKEALEDINYLDLVGYKATWQEEWLDRWNRPLKRGTTNNWISAIRAIYAFAIDKLEIEVKDVGKKLDRPRREDLDRERRVYSPIPPQTFEAILKEAYTQQDHVWLVAIRFAWTSIARISDLFNLRWRDIDFDRKLAVIREPKRGGPKEKVLYDDLLADLGWLREHTRTGPQDFVFHRPRQKKPAFIDWFARHLRKHAKAVGHREHVHPHLIRASAATALSESGVPDRDIMLQGGWKSMASLQYYLREKTDARRDRLREVLDL